MKLFNNIPSIQRKVPNHPPPHTEIDRHDFVLNLSPFYNRIFVFIEVILGVIQLVLP